MPSDALHLALERIEAVFQKNAPNRIGYQEMASDSPLERMQRRVAREPAIRAAIDTACRQWAAGGPWPLSEAEPAVFLWDRIVEARTFGEWLVERGAKVDGEAVDNVLVWLLVDFWVLAGFYRWYARLWAAQRAEG